MPLTKKFVFRIVGEHLRRGLVIFKERSAVSSDGLKDCYIVMLWYSLQYQKVDVCSYQILLLTLGKHSI